MEVEYCVPPGFRFHPTEEELVGYYLTRKVASQKMNLGVINDIDLYRIEPWDLQERCKLGYDEQNEWYFFSHKDRKYPSRTRINRATSAGFWKATGRDKAILSKSRVIGLRKTLVFYEGRAPNGRKSDWIMHEYRLQSSEHGVTQEEGWVVCRAFKKPTPNPRPYYNTYSPFNIREHNQNIEPASIMGSSNSVLANFYEQPLGFVEEMHDPKLNCNIFEILQLNSPTSEISKRSDESSKAQFVDWKVLDNLLTSQLADESASCSNSNLPMVSTMDQYDMINDPTWMN